MKKIFLLSICVAGMLSACGDRNKTTDGFQAEVQQGKEVDKSAMEDDLNKSKTILYTIPSPIEMATIIKEAGSKYDDALLSDLSRSSKYTTNLKMAMNLGIYTTDMSFASIFNQSQKTVDYLNSLKVMTEKLGINQLLDENTIKRMDEKRASKDEMLTTISEVYMNANQYLNENNRMNVAVMVLTGGWVEGIYIALNLVDVNNQNQALTERIVAQKMALATVLNIIDSNNPNDEDEDLNYIRGKMNEIKEIFDEVVIEDATFPSVTNDPDNHRSMIKAGHSGNLSPEILKLLQEKVNEIRTEFIAVE